VSGGGVQAPACGDFSKAKRGNSFNCGIKYTSKSSTCINRLSLSARSFTTNNNSPLCGLARGLKRSVK